MNEVELMTRTVVIEKTGAPEVMQFVDVEIGEPGRGEVLVEHTAIGLSRFDVECRAGIRKVKSLPYTPGVQAVGVVKKVGPDVEALNIGDRVGYCTASGGSYSEERIIDQKYLFKISDVVNDEVAAACIFKAMTAHYLTHRVYDVRPGTFALVYGVSGGVGNIICQWARHKGCEVIGVVGSDGYGVNIARDAGCSYVVNRSDPGVAKEILSITKGKGVNVVYDPIGREVCHLSFSVLGFFGLYISYGQISGPIRNINMSTLGTRSWFVAAPQLQHYKRSRLELALTAMEVFEVVRRGHIKVDVGRVYSFQDIEKAHSDLENRKLSGHCIIRMK